MCTEVSGTVVYRAAQDDNSAAVYLGCLGLRRECIGVIAMRIPRDPEKMEFDFNTECI